MSKWIDGVEHVWDIFENAWVTVAYWGWVNGRGAVEPVERTRDNLSK